MTIDFNVSEFTLTEEFFSAINISYYSPKNKGVHLKDGGLAKYCKDYLKAVFTRKRSKICK
jgi:hypothetical protein